MPEENIFETVYQEAFSEAPGGICGIDMKHGIVIVQ
jgi:hypothetical protein